MACVDDRSSSSIPCSTITNDCPYFFIFVVWGFVCFFHNFLFILYQLLLLVTDYNHSEQTMNDDDWWRNGWTAKWCRNDNSSHLGLCNFFFIIFYLFYTNYSIASSWLQPLWTNDGDEWKKTPFERYPCQAVWSHPRATLQTKSSGIFYSEGSQRSSLRTDLGRLHKAYVFLSVYIISITHKISFWVDAYHHSEFVVKSGMQIDTQALQVNAKRINVPCILYGVGGTAVSNLSIHNLEY
jgi:hypothetical protein